MKPFLFQKTLITLVIPFVIIGCIEMNTLSGDDPQVTSNEIENQELGDHMFFEGDIRIPSDYANTQKPLAKSQGNIFYYGEAPWKGGVVPYVISITEPNAINLINQAMVEFHSKTGIRWVPKGSYDTEYVNFVRLEAACWSDLGRQSGGATLVNFVAGCGFYGALHEMGHALGLVHEHQRLDRDDHIVPPSDWRSDPTNWFPAGTSFGAYDKNSVMNYSDLLEAPGTPPVQVSNSLSAGDIETLGFFYPSSSSHVLDINNDDLSDAVFIKDGIIKIALGQEWEIPITPTDFDPGIGVFPSAYYKVGDFNGDNYDDLIMIVTGTDYIHPFWGNADGTFTVGYFKPWNNYWIQEPAQFHVGDFNNDGRDDLIHFVRTTDYVVTWYGQQNKTFSFGSFSPWPGYAIDGNRVKVGDFDGDGYSDVVDFLYSYIHPWRNNRNGTFNVGPAWRPWTGYAVGSADQYVVSDIRYNDGRDDILHVPYSVLWIGHYNFAAGFYTQM